MFAGDKNDQNRHRGLCPLALHPRQERRTRARCGPTIWRRRWSPALVERTGVKPEDIEDLILGCAFPEGEQGFNVARWSACWRSCRKSRRPAPRSTASAARRCSRSTSRPARSQLGAGEVFICAGVESMSRVPMMGFNPHAQSRSSRKKMPAAYMGMGDTAENVAAQWQITARRAGRIRRAQPAARRRRASGRQVRRRDRADRRARAARSMPTAASAPDTTAEGLAGLKPAFDAERHGHRRHLLAADRRRRRRAGVQRGLCRARRAEAARRGSSRWRSPAARRRSWASARCGATRKALARAGLEIGDIDVVELNEAFASQAIACVRELGIARRDAQHRRRRHRARPSARRDRRAHRRQGGVAAEARRRADTRWPPNASAAARASPPFWRRV